MPVNQRFCLKEYIKNHHPGWRWRPDAADDRRHRARSRGLDRYGRPGAQRPAGRARPDPGPRHRRGARDRLSARDRAATRRPSGSTSCCRAAPIPSWTCWRRIWRASAPRVPPRPTCSVHRVDGFSPEALAASLRELRGISGGIGIIALDHPVVREAIRETAAAGTPVLTMVSDIAQAPRLAYVGIDNRNAGRLAGHLLGRFVPGLGGRGGAVRGLAQLSRPRGARDGLPPHPRGRVPEPDDRRAARGPRRPRAQLPRGQGNCWRRIRGCAASTISAPATAASPGRCEEAGRDQEVVFIGHELTAAHPTVPAGGHHGRRHRPEPSGRGTRGRRSAAERGDGAT